MKKIGVIGTRKRDNPIAFKVVEKRFLEIYEPGDWIVSGACVMHPEDGINEVINRIEGGTEDTIKKYINFHKNTWKVYLI